MKRYLSISLLGVLALSLGLGVAHTTQARQQQAAALARAGTATWEVTAGEGSDGATVNLFLPQTVHLHVGDTVRWHVQGSIEPHLISFGPLATLHNLAAHHASSQVGVHIPVLILTDAEACFMPKAASCTRDDAQSRCPLGHSIRHQSDRYMHPIL